MPGGLGKFVAFTPVTEGDFTTSDTFKPLGEALGSKPAYAVVRYMSRAFCRVLLSTYHSPRQQQLFPCLLVAC